MTFADWLAETRERYRAQPATTATTESAHAFIQGAIRRTLDPVVGRSIWDRGEWDILVVADAARVDMTRGAVGGYPRLPAADSVDAVWSNASCSIDWIQRQFVDKPEETVRTGYVTANPFAHHDEPDTRSADLRDEEIGHLRLLYESEWAALDGGIETVPPERVTDHAIDAWRRRDELGIDRLVVHYMQPHEPFRSRPDWGTGESKLLKNLVEDDAAAGSSVYPQVLDGEVALAELKRAYQDNHHWILGELNDRLLPNVDGEVVITADHANGLDEWGAWHHPPGRIHPAIRRVPWMAVECVDEGTITPSIERQGTDQDVQAQLSALGYTEAEG